VRQIVCDAYCSSVKGIVKAGHGFMISRRGFIAGAAAAALHSQVVKPPNILFVMPDQLRAHALGYMGNSDVRTPNIDRLAGESVVFANTFANTPVCCPARANILTGKYAHMNGMVANDLRLRESENGLSKLLQGRGYRTGFIGKWHLDGGRRLPGFVPPGPRRHGFEFWAANECSHAHFSNHYFRDTPEPIPISKFEAEGWTDLGIEFLNATKTDKRPFFLTVQMGPPHDPYKAPPEYRKMYDAAKLQMRPNWQEKSGLPGREQLAEYYGMITAVDDQVGRLARVLEELGLAEDTLVLFSSDHGDMFGSQGLRLKRKPWEESIRIPGLLRYGRKAPKGGRSDAIFSQVDFAPTLLSLCGIEPPPEMQGSDLAAAVLGTKASSPDSAFFQIFGPFKGDGTEDGWRGVRTGNHMYARFESRPWVLYDLKKDPYETNNLVSDAGSKTLLQDMERRLGEWMKRTGDSWKHNWHAPVEDGGRLYTRNKTFYTVDECLEWEKKNPGAADARSKGQ
ncbi:MAG: sulfatase, partial [Bryobacteraceae bacterium]